MSAKPSPTPSPSLVIDVLKLNKSQLKTLLKPGSGNPLVQFGEAALPFMGGAIGRVPDGTTFQLTVTGSPSWTSLSAGVEFGLKATSSCTVKVIRSGKVFAYRNSLRDGDVASLPSGGAADAYVEIAVDFSLSGNVGGSGAAGGIGIVGDAMASAERCVVVSHRVAPGDLFEEAVRSAFESFVFAVDAGAVEGLALGDVARCTFHGGFSAELTMSYGLGTYKFSAPSVTGVASSLAKYVSIATPSATVDIGASANVAVSYADDLTMVVEKTGQVSAFLYLLHAERSTAGATAGVQADVAVKTGSFALDKTKLKRAVDSLTGGVGGDKAADAAKDLEKKLFAKAQAKVDDAVKNGVGSSVAWERQTQATTLLKYQVDATDAQALGAAWRGLAHGKLTDVFGGNPAMRLLPGSGTHAELANAFTFNLHFFNLHLTDTRTFFQSADVEVTDNGTLRYVFDVGKAAQKETAKALDERRIHFMATAEQITTATVQDAEVVLRFDMSAQGDSNEARQIANVALFAGASEAANTAQKQIQMTVAESPKKNVVLSLVLLPSAYRKLSCSVAPKSDQFQDRLNYREFQSACAQLLPDLTFTSKLDYAHWAACNTSYNGTEVADRRRFGPHAAVPDSLWRGIGVPELCEYFCDNAARFMNLCDDLHALAGLAGSVNDRAHYDALLDTITQYANRDMNTDYSKPAFAAVLALSVSAAAGLDIVNGEESLTCTLTFA